MKFFVLALLVLSFSSCSHRRERPVIVAHRGASGLLPEHTLAAAAAAHVLGADYIEADLVMTRDNRLVVLHDLYLDTTTDVAKKFPGRARADGRFYAIDFDLEEIKSLSAGERINPKTGRPAFPNRFPPNTSAFQVPALEEFIELVQGLNKSSGKNTGIYPEIKKPEFHMAEGKDIAAKTIKVLRRYGYEETRNAYIQCFWPETLKRLKYEFKTSIALVQLTAENSWNESSADYSAMLSPAGLQAVAQYADALGPWMFQLIEPDGDRPNSFGKKSWRPTALAANARVNGLSLHPYTHRSDALPAGISEQELFDLLFESAGADGLFTDFPGRAVQNLKRRQSF